MCQRSVYDPTQKIYTEFKREAIALTRQPGISCRQVALEISISPNLLSRWQCKDDASTGSAFKGSGSPGDEEVARLKREPARVKKERDFLREEEFSSPRSRPEISGDPTLSQ
jgi:transposase